jgi:hypothetical protein
VTTSSLGGRIVDDIGSVCVANVEPRESFKDLPRRLSEFIEAVPFLIFRGFCSLSLDFLYLLGHVGQLTYRVSALKENFGSMMNGQSRSFRFFLVLCGGASIFVVVDIDNLVIVGLPTDANGSTVADCRVVSQDVLVVLYLHRIKPYLLCFIARMRRDGVSQNRFQVVGHSIEV